MTGVRPLLAAAWCAVLLGCGALEAEEAPLASPGPRGGVLKVGIVERPAEYTDPLPYDYYSPDQTPHGSALFRCCLFRTLLNYNGRSTSDGGTVLYPDLASALPTLSADGLSWTFTIRQGIRYAPPFDHYQVGAADFIRGFEWALRQGFEPWVEPLPLASIDGVREYSEGSAGAVVGLEAPDASTLIIRLTRPEGGLGHAVANAAMAPMPPGAADGHDEDYRLFVATTGPYMYAAAGKRDLTQPPALQLGADAGQAPGTLTLVRNPSWDPATDPLRPAYADRIEFRPAGTPAEAIASVEAGEFDLLDMAMAPDDVLRYRNDPLLQSRLVMSTTDSMAVLAMNLALPPFDDVHVRRAVNFVLDRAAVSEAIAAERNREPELFRNESVWLARHALPDSVSNGLLSRYDPFASPGSHGDTAAGQREMALSRYDTDKDGICDAPECRAIPTAYGFREPAELVALDLTAIGLDLDLREVGDGWNMNWPADHVALSVNWFLWSTATSDGMGWAGLVEGGEALVGAPEFVLNQSLVGAPPEALEHWGYNVTNVPSLDRTIDRCRIRSDTPASCAGRNSTSGSRNRWCRGCRSIPVARRGRSRPWW